MFGWCALCARIVYIVIYVIAIFLSVFLCFWLGCLIFGFVSISICVYDLFEFCRFFSHSSSTCILSALRLSNFNLRISGKSLVFSDIWVVVVGNGGNSLYMSSPVIVTIVVIMIVLNFYSLRCRRRRRWCGCCFSSDMKSLSSSHSYSFLFGGVVPTTFF